MLFSMDPLTLAILSSSILPYPHPQNTKDLRGLCYLAWTPSLWPSFLVQFFPILILKILKTRGVYAI